MLETSLKLLKKIEEKGFVAYIIGGYVRDTLLGIDSIDVDITTNATPKDIRDIFQNTVLPSESYGSVTVVIKNIHFEITTFRKESDYIGHRRPTVVEYINNLLEDLQRRDFTINTICMDSEGNIIDLLGAKRDIEKKEIDTVGDSVAKFHEDSLRILRAIRFATKLNFNLKPRVKEAIIANKALLSELSYQRKRQELDKIFASSNARHGINTLLELGLDKELGLHNLKDVKLNTDLIGIWSSLEVDESYPFTNHEKELINSIREIVEERQISNRSLYKYGLYNCSVASDILNINRDIITAKYDNLPIYNRKDINITSEDIVSILNKPAGHYIKEIYLDLEDKILEHHILNEHSQIKRYIIENYLGG